MLTLIQRIAAAGVSRVAVAEREEGQTLVEYALIIGVVAVGLVASLTALKTQVEGLFTTVSNALAGA